MTDPNANHPRGANDPVGVARDLLRRGIMPLPVLANQKNPTIEEWQHLTITSANVAAYFDGMDCNIGARMGEKSGGLVDVDLDSIEALSLKQDFLPETAAIYGRASKRESHHLYRCDDPESKANYQFKDENGKALIDLKSGGGGKGSQSVMPGSRHPSAEFYAWDHDGEPARIAYADLKTAVTKLAVASLLLRFWPESGRNDIALGVGGFLARAGMSADTIFKIVHSICLKRGAKERAEKHAQTAASCVATYQAGTDTRGYPWLEETFGASVAKALAKITDYRTAQEPVAEDDRPAIKVEAGKLSVTADKAEEVLIAAGVLFFERSNSLVRPIVREVDAFRGRKTMAAQFARIDNNILVAGDLTRRVVRTRLDPKMEQPELKEFTGDPVAKVLENRGAYVAAALTICRAYIIAGQPNKKKRLISFEGWSDTVRSAIAWLGMKDPCDSMERIRADDPERGTLAAVLAAWAATFGTGYANRVLLSDVVTAATRVNITNSAGSREFANPELNSAVAAIPTQRQLDATIFSRWLRERKHRIVGTMWFDSESTTHGHKWWIAGVDGQETEPPAL